MTLSQNILNKIISRADKYFHLDKSNFKKLYNKLIPIFYDKTQNFKSNKGFISKTRSKDLWSIRPKYKSNFQCPYPWIDAETWKACKHRSGHIYPKSISTETTKFTSSKDILKLKSSDRRRLEREARESTERCIKSYSDWSRRLSSNERRILGLSGIKASQRLKLFGPRRISTLKGSTGRIQAVNETAKNTNSGYPFYARKNSNKCIKDTINWLEKLFNNPTLYSLMKNPLMTEPVSIFYRTQPSVKNSSNEVKIKIREVWGFPQRIVALEYYFFRNCIKNVYDNNKFGDNCIYSSGLTNFEISEKIVKRLRNEYKGLGPEFSLYSMDYSKFDRTVPSFAIDLFFSIMEESIQFENEKELNLFQMLRVYFKFSPFCYKNKFYMKKKGVPSGSYITNTIDSWWNLTLWIYTKSISDYYETRTNDFLNKENLLDDKVYEFIIMNNSISDMSNLGICGDDSLIYTTKMHIFIIKRFCETINMKIDVFLETEDYRSDIYFLGRYWNKDNEPIQTDLYMFSHIVIRSKFYKKDEVNFDISEQLELNRILSITLQFANGKEFIDKHLSHFKNLKNYFESNKGFYLLKEYPLKEGYSFINRIDSMSWKKM